MRIIHFSDPHAGGPAEDFLAYLDKRWVGVFNYTFQRRFRYNLKRLGHAVDYIVSTRPDVAVCTGDLTSSGQPGEFAKVVELLKPIGEAKIPLLYLPGNHDCYVKRPKCVAAVRQAVHTLTQGREEFADFPLVRDFGEVEFFLVNTSRPSALLFSGGYLSKADSAAIEKWCEAPHLKPRILLSHYPITEDHPILRFRHRLYGQKRAAELLAKREIDLMLCGHIHRPYRKVDATGRGECCAGSVTLNGTMTEIDYDPETRNFTYNAVKI